MIIRSIQLIILVLLAALAMPGQQSATVTGTVRDASAGVVEAAGVKLINAQTRETFTGVTTGNGLYTIPLVKPGEYELVVEAPGFKQQRQTGIRLETGSSVAGACSSSVSGLPLLRGVTPKALDAFDPVAQTLVTGQRETTTVPTQALFLLNSAFVRRQALALAEQLLTEPSPAARIRTGYRRVLGREPAAEEVTRAQRFVDSFETAYAATPREPIAKVAVPVRLAPPAAPPPPPVDPDNIDRTDYLAAGEAVEPVYDARLAAWMSFAQSLFASAEFRFVR